DRAALNAAACRARRIARPRARKHGAQPPTRYRHESTHLIETLLPLNIPIGMFANGTVYQASNRWYKGHLVRWVDGALRPVGGWTTALTGAGAAIQATGVPRCAVAWRKNDSTAWIAVGTHTKLEAYSGGVLTDITPAGIVT